MSEESWETPEHGWLTHECVIKLVHSLVVLETDEGAKSRARLLSLKMLFLPK